MTSRMQSDASLIGMGDSTECRNRETNYSENEMTHFMPQDISECVGTPKAKVKKPKNIFRVSCFCLCEKLFCVYLKSRNKSSEQGAPAWPPMKSVLVGYTIFKILRW